MGLMCPQPQLGPAAFVLVEDVSIRHRHESKAGRGFSPCAKLFGCWLAGRFPGGVPGQVGQGFEQPWLVEGVPAHGGELERDDL